MGSLANKKQTCLNNPLFRYIKPYNNDLFSKMNGRDLQDLLYYVDNYYLELRNRLGFDDYITFGLELEFENVKYRKLLDKFNALKSEWIMKHDPSLDDGAEINSPILTDEKIYWDQLKKICLFVQKNIIHLKSVQDGRISLFTLDMNLRV